MSYAVPQDVSERYNEDLLLLLGDQDHDGEVDEGVWEKALSDATDEINAYVATKYTLPLPSVPTMLTRICVDIAAYRLSADADVATEERRTRYTDAISFLKSVSTGLVSLGEATPPPSSNGVAFVAGPDRLFKRGSL